MNRKDEIARNLAEVKERIRQTCLIAERDPSEITLIVVTKNFPTSDAQILYDLGEREFGENRDQEGSLKSEQLPADITWHFQGQIQSRKIKSIASWADQIHSLDSLEHAKKFDQVGHEKAREFFLQVNLEPERPDRGGVAPTEVEGFLEALLRQTEISPVGLMVVAPQEMEALQAFTKVRELQESLLGAFPALGKLSMGMSGDFEAAIAAGATHLRIGSSILGSRG